MKTPLFSLPILVLLIGCAKNNDPVATRPLLKSYMTSFQNQSGGFRPGEKIEYYYSPAGTLVKEKQSEYDSEAKVFVHFSTSNYSYSQGKLISIDKIIEGSPDKIVTTYEYANNQIVKIKVDDNVDMEATIQYLAGNRVEILYSFSNGRFFTYHFTSNNDNKEFEQTLNELQQVSSEITHQYDNKKNPFILLGYTDVFFSNSSVNNRIKTTSNYISDAFPQSVPVSYVYDYNSSDFPTQQITTYKSTGGSGTTNLSKTEFEYW